MTEFIKYQGIGNDFVLIDCMNGSVSAVPEFVRTVCDRHFGVGADGILYVMPADNADMTMKIMNADGTEAEMCGNGIRCVAHYAFSAGIAGSREFKINTLAGIKTAKILKNGMTEIDMGAPILNGRDIPMDHDGRFLNEPIDVDGIRIHGNGVSMGNPHLVVFDDLDGAQIEILGPILERHPLFPKRTNVEFAEIVDGTIRVRVYERGAAWTMACGTGACAATVAAALNGHIKFNVPVDVHLPGGWLNITVDEKLKSVKMAGPAEPVFKGRLM